jgi:DHA2 family multidrug resistance protein
LIEMPVVGALTSKVQARYLIAFGWLSMALAMLYSTTHFGLFLDFWAATRIRTTQVVGIGFLFVPITLVAYVGIPQAQSNMVSGLINFMRNMGSSVGTSIVTTMIARRAQYHQTVLTDNLSQGNPAFLNSVGGLTSRLMRAGYSLDDAHARAHETLYRAAQQQSATLAYIDTFWILGIAAAIMFGLSFLLKRNEPGQGAVHAE